MKEFKSGVIGAPSEENAESAESYGERVSKNYLGGITATGAEVKSETENVGAAEEKTENVDAAEEKTEETASDENAPENDAEPPFYDAAKADIIPENDGEKGFSERISVNTRKNNVIKSYFNAEPLPKEVEEIADIFMQSDTEIKREFGTFKARKLYSQLNYDLLDPSLTGELFYRKLKLAVRYGIKTVTVYPSEVKLAKAALKGSGAEIRTVISYPYGNDIFKTRYYAFKKEIIAADGIIVPVPTGKIKNADFRGIVREFKKLVKKSAGKKVTAYFDMDIINAEEAETVIKAFAGEIKIHSVLLSSFNSDYVLDPTVLKNAVSAADGRFFVEGGGVISSPEDVVTLLRKGAISVMSANAIRIAENLNLRINVSGNA